MRPIPIGATAAMVFSLLVAFVVTPWATIRLMRCGGEHEGDGGEGKMTRVYRRVMSKLLRVARLRYAFPRDRRRAALGRHVTGRR